MLLILNLPLVGIFASIVRIPARYLVPIILVLCIMGAYGDNNNLFDVWIMLGAGVAGYLMRRVATALKIKQRANPTHSSAFFPCSAVNRPTTANAIGLPPPLQTSIHLRKELSKDLAPPLRGRPRFPFREEIWYNVTWQVVT